jgi:hypothetical protein
MAQRVHKMKAGEQSLSKWAGLSRPWILFALGAVRGFDVENRFYGDLNLCLGQSTNRRPTPGVTRTVESL